MDTNKRRVLSESRDHESLVANTFKRLKSDSAVNQTIGSYLTPFVKFDQSGYFGIPERLQKLNNVDIQNINDSLPKYTAGYRDDVSYTDYCHVHQYLSAKEFNESLLSDKKFDSVVNSIISYLLDWPDAKLNEFVSLYPKYDRLCAALKEFRELEDGKYVYTYNGIPVVRTAIKIIKSHFAPKNEGRKVFDWMSLIDYSFIQHINQVYNWLLNDNFDVDKIALLESDMEIPYKLPHIDVEKLKNNRRDNTFKFISGEACCCKTTIMNKLSELGWKSYSRGDVGSFSGKSHSPAAIGNLHAALHFILTQPDVIGDRGFIDNVIWEFIMPECNPIKREGLIRDLFSFLNSNFNEPSIAEYISHKGVIFVDTNTTQNKERQLKRCEDGDPWRARLDMYPIAQFMTYYVTARLFGWKVICVPYSNDDQIDNVRYNRNIQTIMDYFGKPILTDLPYVKFSKPSNSYEIDNSYPKSVGIFK